MSSKYLAPPQLNTDRYDAWRKEMSLWEMATSIEKKKRAPTVFLTLEGKAREAVLEMDLPTLNEDNGMTLLYDKLDTLFKEDKNQSAFIAYETFEKYQRPSDMSVCDYLIEFDRLTAKLKDYQIQLPEPVLAYRALKSANLTQENEKLIKATVSELTVKAMAEQLKKVMRSFSSTVSSDATVPAIQIKREIDVAYTDDKTSLKDSISEAQAESEASDEVLYNNWGGRRSFRGSNRRNRSFRRGSTNRNFSRSTGRRHNPPGLDGKPSKCNICGCTFHWARYCPYAENNPLESKSEDYVHDTNIVLFSDSHADNYIHDSNIVLVGANPADNGPSFLGETVGSVVLDSGASGTVCGEEWYNCFLDTLPDGVKSKIDVQEGNRSYKFGSGEVFQSLYRVKLPCILADRKVFIVTDVVKAEIPLLLSKAAMKRAKTNLNFVNDTVFMLGRNIKLKCTSSGHYYVPLSSWIFPEDTDVGYVLFVKDMARKSKQEKLKIATKLHRQFSHPSGKKLCGVAKDAGMKDKEFMEILEDIPASCEFCLRHKKVEPRPIVGFSLGSYFNETVAMDIKEILGKKVLHLVDHGTRYSVAIELRSKESSEIVGVFFKYWVAYFGAPLSVLTDNGGEFNSQCFRDMAQNMNIVVQTTAAQSPWSNGLNERHNGILGEMVKKTVEDVNCSFEVALAWAVSAKNSLHSVNGYSPNQLVFGRNPNLPAILIDQLPALEGITTSEIVADNLNAKHSARKAFVECESSEKLRRALRHQVRKSCSQSYGNGDRVLYKRNECDRWLGPGTVIGWENKQVLVKHGGTYVRVHPSRLSMYSRKINDTCSTPVEEMSAVTSAAPCIHTQKSNGESTAADLNGDVEPLEHVDQMDNMEEDEIRPQVVLPRPRGRPPKRPHPSVSSKVVEVPTPGQVISCKLANDNEGEWRRMNVISRAGKATGVNKYMMNVVLDQGDPFWLDFQHGVTEWKLDHAEQISDGEDVMLVYRNDELEVAKKKELQKWRKNQVYEQVPDNGQPRIHTRWVCTNSNLAVGESEVKARLVAKGFQDVEAGNIRSDSPTCSKEGILIAMGIMKSNGWICKSMDIETAFLQGRKFNRQVYLCPPPEANVPDGFIWKLCKCVYGLSDASRAWYLTVREELMKLGAVPSKYDQAIFSWYFNGKLHGIITTHVDDFCFGGSKIFHTSVMDRIRRVFKVKCEESANFKYIGLDVKKISDSIRIGQDEYVKNLVPISVGTDRNVQEKISKEEVTKVRQLIGQLNWLATQTRPDLSYDISDLSSVVKQQNVECIKQVNKALKKAKKEKSQISVPDLGDLESLKLVVYSDASFANLLDGGSQGGYVIFLQGENGEYLPISWQSKRVKRVVKSTLAAETLAMVDAAEAAVYYRKFILELLGLKDSVRSVPIVCCTDNSSLYDAVHSSTQVQDKRLRIEIAILREMLNKCEIKRVAWVESGKQIADSLTKKGIPSFKILGYFSEPKESLSV